MATYKEIKGVTIQTRDSDPNVGGVAGGTWASGGNVNTGRYAMGSVGLQTAALIAAGSTGSNSDATEQYNGSSWTEVNEVNTARNSQQAAGTYTAALLIGGYTSSPVANVEIWDGSNWTETGDLTTNTSNNGCFGTTAAAVSAAGSGPGGSPYNDDQVMTWNGSSWTEVAEVNTGRYASTGSGSSTAGMISGGKNPAFANAEQWNGSAWTEVADLNTARGSASSTNSAASSPYNDTLVFCGNPPATGKTEHFDGTSWTEVNDASSAREGAGGSGTSAAAIAATGSTTGGGPGVITGTEEFTIQSSPVLVEGMIFLSGGTTLKGFGRAAGIPAATWASGGNLNQGRGNAGSSGTQTATLFFGGEPPGGAQSALTEQYDGSSWTEVADLNVARGQQFFSNQGTQTAALSATGVPLQTSVESWNGSSWTETTDLNTARRNGASLGTQGAMLGTGGYNPPSYRTLTEIWDGSSWTETGDCPDAKFVCRGGGGTTTAGIIAGNYPNGDVDSSQTWDGTSWTNGPNINTGRSGIAFSAQTQSSALGHGGGTGTPQAAQTKTEFFNGTSWTELNDLSTASQQGGGAGSSVSGIHMGGYPGVSATEEWTADNTLADVTVS